MRLCCFCTPAGYQRFSPTNTQTTFSETKASLPPSMVVGVLSHIGFHPARAEAASPFSTSCLKLRRYSSTLWERLGGSKIERIFNVTSVCSSERGSKETTPDMKPSDIVRHAIRRPGICSTMWNNPCCSWPLGCHVYEKCVSSILRTSCNGGINFGRSSIRDHCS